MDGGGEKRLISSAALNDEEAAFDELVVFTPATFINDSGGGYQGAALRLNPTE